MRPVVYLALLVVASGCAAGGAPIVVIAPPPAATVEPPERLPGPATPRPEVVDLSPVVPPETPKLQIDRRTVYEQVGVTEWTLANGLTVVYRHEPDGDRYRVRVQAPTGWADLPATMRAPYVEAEGTTRGPLVLAVEPHRRVAVGRSETLTDLVDAVASLFSGEPPASASGAVARAFDRPASFLVVLSGRAEREWVEPVIANELAQLRGRDNSFGPVLEAPDPIASALTAEARATWDDLPATAILSRALAVRAGAGVQVSYDAASGRVYLRADVGTPRDDLFRPFSDDALRRARSDSAADAASPDGRLLALATLYEVPGTFRPARRPTEAITLPERIARTPPDRVAALLRQLAGAALVTAPPPPSTSD